MLVDMKPHPVSFPDKTREISSILGQPRRDRPGMMHGFHLYSAEALKAFEQFQQAAVHVA